jgi:hypothetical protein
MGLAEALLLEHSAGQVSISLRFLTKKALAPSDSPSLETRRFCVPEDGARTSCRYFRSGRHAAVTWAGMARAEAG